MAQGNNMSSLEALIKAAQFLEENGEGGTVFKYICWDWLGIFLGI